MKLKTQFWKSAWVVFSNRLLTVYAILLGLMGGVLSVPWSLSVIKSGEIPVGAISIGPWITRPNLGTPDIDPYALAIIADNSDIPLGKGEGMMLKASTDSLGQRLVTSCQYTIEADVPAARFWTLSFYDKRGQKIITALKRTGFTSSEILRDNDGKFSIHASSIPNPGNWIQLEGKTSFEIILRLYDLPASLSANLLEPGQLPSIIRKGCKP